ncbi:hypothetical protein C8Q74DRAFT_1215151 [Fomes fomentarius]|nr:hypothetical protein C8Q74DRAFT_1215151 [Fomes fomentarius]
MLEVNRSPEDSKFVAARLKLCWMHYLSREVANEKIHYNRPQKGGPYMLDDNTSPVVLNNRDLIIGAPFPGELHVRVAATKDFTLCEFTNHLAVYLPSPGARLHGRVGGKTARRAARLVNMDANLEDEVPSLSAVLLYTHEDREADANMFIEAGVLKLS